MNQLRGYCLPWDLLTKMQSKLMKFVKKILRKVFHSLKRKCIANRNSLNYFANMALISEGHEDLRYEIKKTYEIFYQFNSFKEPIIQKIRLE